MKRKTGILIILMLVAVFAAGCVGSTGENTAAKTDINSLKTIGDVQSLESSGYACSSDQFVTVVSANGNYYRVEADIPEDVSARIDELSWEDEDHDQKMEELVAPLPISKITNLSEQLLSQDELDKMKGKTGGDLFEDGWIPSGFYPDPQSVVMTLGFFQYRVTFESDIPSADEEINDNADTEESMKALRIKTIDYLGLASSATEPD